MSAALLRQLAEVQDVAADMSHMTRRNPAFHCVAKIIAAK